MDQEKSSSYMADMGKAFLTWRRYLQKKEALPYGITLKQLYVLRQLEKTKSLFPSDVAAMLYCDRPTATVVIKNMEKYGWVKREPDQDDSRRIKITLEPAGQVKMKEINQKQAVSRGTLFDPLACFNREEKEKFADLLTKLNRHLQQIM